MTDDKVIIRQNGRIGQLLLDRPQALNALDSGMIAALAEALTHWRDDPIIEAVVIEGNDRAFCAGGDVRQARAWLLAGQPDTVDTYFAAEYALNQMIAEYPKPFIALVDGICFGGGIGLAVHGSHRVATEAAVFAMPETAIGLFPDVGASYLLPRLPGALGMAMGLTGLRITGADAVHAGLATHYLPRTSLPALRTALAQDGVAAVAQAAAPLPADNLAAHRAALDHCFAAPDLPGILARLNDAAGAWAVELKKSLQTASPSALCWTHRLLRDGADRTLPHCLATELALVRQVVRHPDFAEGVRAILVDKDRQPHWRPARLQDVDPAMIAALFDTPAQP